MLMNDNLRSYELPNLDINFERHIWEILFTDLQNILCKTALCNQPEISLTYAFHITWNQSNLVNET